MNFTGLNKIFREANEYKAIISSIKDSKTPCQVHGLSETQKSYISYCLFDEFNKQTVILTHNEIEAKKLYDDISIFTDKCAYFPAKEMVFNVDVTSGEIKTERLNIIKKVLGKETLIVIASVDAIFYRMPPREVFIDSYYELRTGDNIEIIDLASKLVDYGYERVEIVEGKGQFAQRGGIIDIFPSVSDTPLRVEFFGDEIDTIRSFDILTQRSQESVEYVPVYPTREVLIKPDSLNKIVESIQNNLDAKYKAYSKKNKLIADNLKSRVNENIDKLKNNRYFEGIDSYIPIIYEKPDCFLDYFSEPVVIIDESARVVGRIRSAFEEFQYTFKSMLDKGDILPVQGEYMLPEEEILDNIKTNKVLSLNMLSRIVEAIKPLSIVNFNALSMNPLSGKMEFLIDEIKEKIKKNYHILIMAGTSSRGYRLVDAFKQEGIEAVYKEDINEIKEGIVVVTSSSISRGMEFPDIKLSIISEKEVYKEKKDRPRNFAKKGRKIESFTDLKAGDYVVHVNHGIGQFKGIKELIVDGVKRDYLFLQYQGGDTLYVPVEQLDMVQKYIGAEEGKPKIYKLGGSDWVKTKKKVKESLKQMAEDLVKLYALRSTIGGYAFSKDTVWQKEFEDEFPYEETADQLSAIEDIKKDMEKPKLMDRLLCGDVGYGKTEVAMRACFKAVMDSKQVAVLVPTTILAEQHYNNFKQRFADYPIRIEMLSRFRSQQQQKNTLRELMAGNIDIIIGTHKLLNKDIKYKDLGLLIVDEEQRFGVSHKERIKVLKKNIDVLTLTATPIPRTLHMSLIGVRDMSLIETPPQERYPVQTYVMEYNEGIIRDSVIREISRGGQLFFVYNRVETIMDMQSQLRRIVPEAKIVVAHGQMNEKELEEAILAFIAGEGDILLCTTIIETGIDIPNVNTLIVYDSDRMGLSQLYQLRGRVGRSNRLAYAYFTYRKDKILTETAEKRLKAIKEFTEFGSGFKIAMRDLEIRGAGNLLGSQQHGHMGAVGYDLYCRLLEESVKEINGEVREEYIETSIELPIDAYIPSNYIEDEILKIEIYKKIATIENDEEKMDIEEELIDRFGDIPKVTENLINIAYIKAAARKARITNIRQNDKIIYINFKNGNDISINNIRAINGKMDNAVSYGSTTLPVLKLTATSTNSTEIIRVLKNFLKEITSLQCNLQ